MADPNQPVPADPNTSDVQASPPPPPATGGTDTGTAPPPPPWVSAPQTAETPPTAPEAPSQAPEQVVDTQPAVTEEAPSFEQTTPAPPAAQDVTGTESVQPEMPAEMPETPPSPPGISPEETIPPTEQITLQPEDSGIIPPTVPPPSFSTSSVAAAPVGAGAGPKSSIFKNLIPILGVLAFIGILVFVVVKFVLPNFSKKPEEGEKVSKKKASLTYWGLWEPESVINQIIADYQQTHPNISINYVRQSHKDYRERLQSALISDTGPDIFRFHNTWVPMLRSSLEPAPSGTIDLSLYYPVVSLDLKINQKAYGVPLELDGLALFYNPTILSQAGKSIPATWEELQKTAAELTVRDSAGRIQTAGIALGTTNNVDNFSDILGLMLLQNGADPSKASSQLVQDAVEFYTIFTTRDKIWDETLPSSTYAFATEKVAMFFAPSWRAFEIKEINPDLEFATAPVPQLPGAQVAWASYWVEGVSKKSKNTTEAWEFLKYLSSESVVTKLYTLESDLRLFGEPYGLKSLSSSLENDTYAGAFVKQGPYAKSWYLCSRTFDNGINDRTIKYFEDAINSVVSGKDIEASLKTAASGVSQVLSQYGLGKTPTQQLSEPQISTPSSTTPTSPEEI